MSDQSAFDSIDALIKRVHQLQNADLQVEIDRRSRRAPTMDLTDSQLLRLCIELIAFSQQSRAAAVEDLIATRVLEQAFCGFDVQQVSELDHERIYSEYWSRMGALRFPTKLRSMVECARSFRRIGETQSSFIEFLNSFQIPATINSLADIEQFWSRFDALKNELSRLEMPFFNQQTSLCHLLMMLGHDCAKPDSMVMAAAAQLGIEPASSSGSQNHSDSARRRVVRTMQEYCVDRRVRMPVLDLYFLICGRQSSVIHLVQPTFYCMA
jgi:hypothetical protein